MQILKDDVHILRVSIQSRHTSSKAYRLWIEYGRDGKSINGWYCKCRTGARTLGCCAHVAAVLWYLGYERHLENKSERYCREYPKYTVDAAATWSDEEETDSSSSDDDEL